LARTCRVLSVTERSAIRALGVFHVVLAPGLRSSKSSIPFALEFFDENSRLGQPSAHIRRVLIGMQRQACAAVFGPKRSTTPPFRRLGLALDYRRIWSSSFSSSSGVLRSQTSRRIVPRLLVVHLFLRQRCTPKPDLRNSPWPGKDASQQIRQVLGCRYPLLP